MKPILLCYEKEDKDTTKKNYRSISLISIDTILNNKKKSLGNPNQEHIKTHE
jgi:hypothetical protein